MTLFAEFIVSTGSYQHVKLTFQVTSSVELANQLANFTDEMKQKLGIFQAELESWVGPTYQQAVNGQHVELVKEVAGALGASVVEETATEPAPAKDTRVRPWETAPVADLSDF